MVVRFFLPGIPRPQGSKRALPRKGGGTVLVESSPDVKSWRNDIASAALAMRPTDWGFLDAREPVRVFAVFALPRPASHLGARGLRSGAPLFPVSKPDGDKLLRAVLDALTGILYRDDSAVVAWPGEKRYTRAEPGLYLEVERGLVFTEASHSAEHLVERLGYVVSNREILGGMSARQAR